MPRGWSRIGDSFRLRFDPAYIIALSGLIEILEMVVVVTTG